MNMPRHRARAPARPVRARSAPLPGGQLEELVLSALDASNVPLSAYSLTERLRDQGHHVVIPSMYRALDRLCLKGLIEKVEMLSAYRIGEREKHVRLVCLKCGETRGHSIPELYDMLIVSAEKTGFDISKVALKLAGCCPACRDRD